MHQTLLIAASSMTPCDVSHPIAISSLALSRADPREPSPGRAARLAMRDRRERDHASRSPRRQARVVDSVLPDHPGA